MLSRTLLLSILLLAALLAAGCSDDNRDAPAVDEAHPPQWIFEHGEEAREDLTRCQSCHAADFRGNGEAVSCFDCHLQGPPQFATFGIHPFHWDNVIEDHQEFPLEFSWTTCANSACHGEKLQGGLLGPSCFLAACHAEGPPAPASHDVPAGESFFEPENHGPLAQNDLFYCRNCHGRPPYFFDGGYVADPQIGNSAIGNCSLAFCHPTAMAHPADWLQFSGGPVSAEDRAIIYFATHTDLARSAIDRGCQLCHQTKVADSNPLAAAPSCLLCHPGGF